MEWERVYENVTSKESFVSRGTGVLTNDSYRNQCKQYTTFNLSSVYLNANTSTYAEHGMALRNPNRGLVVHQASTRHVNKEKPFYIYEQFNRVAHNRLMSRQHRAKYPDIEAFGAVTFNNRQCPNSESIIARLST
ncbi:hypothetical protein F5884DRAFT_754203 [Xylogone sp. PMI_703]|nr:hypothetical protein F5884DRAFT_754203 [Xylogone sp. PMI_703]